MQNQVAEFMRACGQHIATETHEDNVTQGRLWVSLIAEEIDEVKAAIADYAGMPRSVDFQANLTAEMADLLYVLFGLANSQGLPLEAMFNEVHNANMRKVDPATGQVRKNKSGKVLKPSDWVGPNKVGVIRNAGG